MLLAHIRERFCLSRETYGSPRMHADLIEDHRQGPEVDHDMMNSERQDMFLCRSSEQTHPHDRPAFQIKRALRFFDQPGLQLILAQS